jgi:hypothetical protein
MKKIVLIIFPVIFALSAVSISIAAENTGERQNASEYQIPPPAGGTQVQGQPPHRRTPPKEISDACIGKNQEDACEFNAPHGKVTGICRTIHNQLACTPKGEPRKEKQQP